MPLRKLDDPVSTSRKMNCVDVLKVAVKVTVTDRISNTFRFKFFERSGHEAKKTASLGSWMLCLSLTEFGH